MQPRPQGDDGASLRQSEAADPGWHLPRVVPPGHGIEGVQGGPADIDPEQSSESGMPPRPFAVQGPGGQDQFKLHAEAFHVALTPPESPSRSKSNVKDATEKFVPFSGNGYARTCPHRGSGRALRGVKLVISDGHEGIKAAVTKVLSATSQRCRVHFMRNALAHAGRSGRRVVSAFIATGFAQDDAEAARQQWRRVADQLRPKVPKLARLMDHSEADVLAYMTFPPQHRTKLHSTNPLERLNRPARPLHDAGNNQRHER